MNPFSVWLTRLGWRLAFTLACWTFLLHQAAAALPQREHPDLLVARWLAGEGVLENSALGVAQTPDGYLWVASSGGLLRFNGHEFKVAEQIFGLPRLNMVIVSVNADRSGRLWAGTLRGTLLWEKGVWRELGPTNLTVRSVAENAQGQVLLGSYDGRTLLYDGREARELAMPPGLPPSGVFCIRDEADGGIWMANRGFIGRWKDGGWEKIGPGGTVSDSVVAAPALGGGMLVYGVGEIHRYRPGQPPELLHRLQSLDQPRQLLQTRDGAIWLASSTRGLLRVASDGSVSALTTANGLAHNSIRSLLEDREGNVWVGTSNGGLHRLRPRHFRTLDSEDGLPDRIARTITPGPDGQMLVGTHGGGTARILEDRVVWSRPVTADPAGRYAWSVLHDSSGRGWTGTFLGGLLVEENGVETQYPLPAELGNTVYALMEDSRKRIWIGAVAGLGVIENGVCRRWTNAALPEGLSIRAIAEEPKTGALWLGTFSAGLLRVEGTKATAYGPAQGLPGLRISTLACDDDGCVWAGVFGQGLVCIEGGRLMRITREQGLPANTVGSLIDDRLGNFWLGSDLGILRVSREELHLAARGVKARAQFSAFNEGDGLRNAECSEGYQPTAARDASGRLWFATLGGVVSLDPRTIRVNPLPPPVVIESVTYRDTEGRRRQILSPVSEISLPAGSTELSVACAALSYSAPEKVRYAFRAGERQRGWTDMGARRDIYFHSPAPGQFSLQIKAANNDGVWNERGVTLGVTIQAFYWQTAWFRWGGGGFLLAATGVGGWQISRRRIRREREKLEQQNLLAREKARLASVLEGTTDFVGFASADGRAFYVNPAGRRLIGLGPDTDVTTMNFRSFHPPTMAERFWNEAVPHARQAGTWSGESALRHAAGHEIPVSQVLVAHLDAAGEVQFYSTVIRDISERTRSEAALRNSEARLRAIVHNTPNVAMQGYDLEGRVRLWNHASVLMFGWTAEEAMGQPLDQLIHTPEEFRSFVQTLRGLAGTGRAVGPAEFQFRQRNGGTVWCLSTIFEIPGEGAEPMFVCMDVDITERKRAEEAQAMLEAQLRQAQKMEAIGTLAGGIAHDFNNILTAIMAFTELARQESYGNAQALESLDEVFKASERAKDLVRQILTFSRRQHLERKVIRLQPVVEETLKLLRSTLPAAIEIATDIQPTAGTVQADSSQIHQVVMNLCTNAAQSLGERGGRIDIRLRAVSVDTPLAMSVPDLRPGPFVRLSVSDNGAGMSPDTMKRIFEPFFTTKGPGAGSGLGLAVVYGIVKEHEGAIQVQSEPGRGATFHVYLPRREGGAETPVPPTTQPLPGKGERILLVDDEVALARAAQRGLQRLGYHITVSNRPEEALELFRANPSAVDLVITDLSMPGMLGTDLAAQMLALRPDLPVILITGDNANWPLEKLRRLGLRDLLLKPFTIPDLSKTVQATLAAK